MPAQYGKNQKAARELRKRLNIEHIMHQTDVFNHSIIGEPTLDKRTYPRFKPL